ncbi:MAG: AzlD domain-containing protein, partial [Treponema sp.]|nr:AzlD domain-containing protein [Treponema sp.]
MKVSLNAALGLTCAMGGIIFFCRFFPFLFFKTRNGGGDHPRREALLAFVEKTVPPAAMTVLAFNAIAGSFKADLREGIPALIAAALTALIHLRKRNPLFSIFGGTAAYMIL